MYLAWGVLILAVLFGLWPDAVIAVIFFLISVAAGVFFGGVLGGFVFTLTGSTLAGWAVGLVAGYLLLVFVWVGLIR